MFEEIKKAMKTKLLYVVTFLVTSFSLTSQNLINPSSWTVGSGSVAGFSQYGNSSENIREYSAGPKGTSVLLWKAVPDASVNADGGFHSPKVNIDHKKTYRLSVWIKKTNSRNGSTQLKPYSSSGGQLHTTDLNGSNLTWHPFWYGSLPQLNKWYLLVGYIHGSDYNSTNSFGKIYDTSGNVVINMKDHKFKSSATVLQHRTILWGDTNTSDRQYMYEPKIELVDGNEPSVEELLGLNNSNSGNFLAQYLTNWTVGSGSVSGFGQNGVTSENSRELGRNHIGEEVVLWKASPSGNYYEDGGWNTSWINGINSNLSYRYSVWVKKTNSNDGKTYFGFYANNSGSLRLSGSYNGNPYFFVGDLPKLNRWYLLVGYVHKSSHTGTTNSGGIYDGTTGEKVRTLTDYKLKNNVTSLRHRSYLYYDRNTLDRQYFYEPRIDKITGNEPTIHELLKINDDSKLIMSYDIAGNQTQNFYCSDPSYCAPPAARKKQEKVIRKEEVIAETEPEEEIEPVYENQLTVFPNPTENRVSIRVEQELLAQIHTIRIYNTNSTLLQNLSFNKANKIEVDLTNKPAGVYFLHLHLKNGKSITKKIIKK